MYQVFLPYATYGLETKDDIIVAAPPIARWMIGKHIDAIRSFLDRKQGKIKPLDVREVNNAERGDNQELETPR